LTYVEYFVMLIIFSTFTKTMYDEGFNHNCSAFYQMFFFKNLFPIEIKILYSTCFTHFILFSNIHY